jgi:beta-1,2-mannobiose phosphorylase / 1,2-beta-oligomannan phosphorylase
MNATIAYNEFGSFFGNLLSRKRVKIPPPKLRKKEKIVSFLSRFQNNPIIQPKPENFWESKATFNCAAIYENKKVHLVYRAIGDNDISVLGYASSHDGFHIDKQLDKPIYTPKEDFEGAPIANNPPLTGWSPYMSGGGGLGGCEDPRITKIGDKLYMLYVAYNGWSHPRIAMTSISLKDFLSHHWNWTKSVLISPPGVVDKNACILPEKIKGKYVIFHRIYPDILIDFVDDLNFDGKSNWLKGQYKIRPRKTFWDSRKIGTGPPPIKTEKGWLLIYQAIGEQDPSRYKIGAMLLDLKNPARVIARSKKPILEPCEQYENDGWKSGVVYPCGAVVINNQLIIYYGGADKVTCAASAKLDKFISDLISTKKPTLKRVDLKKVNLKDIGNI